MKRQGGDISSAVHDLLKDLVQRRGVPADYLARQVGVPEATLHAWLKGELAGLDISHVAALHEVAKKPLGAQSGLELAPAPSSFPPGATVADAVEALDSRMQRLEQNLAIQSDLLRQVWHLSGRFQSAEPGPADLDSADLEASAASTDHSDENRHDEWSLQLSTYARDGLISEAIGILDELIASQGGGHVC